MIRALALAALLILSAGTAIAGLSRSDLARVSVTLSPGAHVDLDATAHDTSERALTMRQVLDGRPALLTFADFTCTSLCGSDLRLLSQALESAGLGPDEYRLVVIGIDPKDTPAAAEAMAAGEMAADVRANTVLLLPDAPTVQRLTTVLGFHYAYDPAIDQFAHPAAAYVIAANGVATSVLSPFALDVSALKSALRAPSGTPSSFVDRIRILCYALDPATGIYTLRIMALLKAGAALTLVLVAAGVLLFARRTRS